MDKNCAVVVDTSRSPHCRLKPVGINQVRLQDQFWEPRIEINRTVTIPSQYEQCESSGRIDNFRRASGRKHGEFQGIFFNDSDVYKWLEAAAFSLASHPDPALEKTVDTVIDEISAAQQSNGYLNTYFMFEREKDRWTNLRDMHELYCAGHLIQAAVAHHRATGKRTILDTVIRLTDHICSVFGPDGKPGTCGHEEIEMALVELYRETGEERYLQQAEIFINNRGKKPPVIGGSPYHQDHRPVREMDEVIGHAVRMMYLTCGVTDVYAETGEDALMQALDRLWQHMVGRRMYITGGLGARYEGEAFGKDFELPNDRAYTETCAAIGSVMWNWRLLAVGGNARYADLMEHTLYNAVLPGLSLDGKRYFYQNPLEDDGQHRRREWFDCACCPPNVARLLASLPGYFYSTSDEGAWVHLYARGQANLTLPGGEQFSLRQDTDYPWNGEIAIEVLSSPEEPASLFLRIPAWCTAPSIRIAGDPARDVSPGSYVELQRTWKPGDKVEITLPMEVRRFESHPHLSSNTGQVALTRGPLIYCIESADHPGQEIRDICLPPGSALTTRFRSDLLGGVQIVETKGEVRNNSVWSGTLYRPADGKTREPFQRAPITAIPYYAWSNREPGPMRVWLPVGGQVGN